MMDEVTEAEDRLARILLEQGPSAFIHQIRSVLSHKTHVKLVNIKDETNGLLDASIIVKATMAVGDPFLIEGMEVKCSAEGASLISKEGFLEWIAAFVDLLAEELANRNYGFGIDRSSVGELAKAACTLPFDEADIRALISHIDKNRAKGLMTSFDSAMEGKINEWLMRGLVCVSLPEIGRSILYIKKDAGKGLFGKQKSVYGAYFGSMGEDAFIPGPTFKNWYVAITAMNNIYRGEGLL